MTHPSKYVSVYNYLVTLAFSAISLFLAIYLSVLESSLYLYFVPLCTLFFLISFIVYTKTNKELKEDTSTNHYQFYYHSFGVYLLTLLYFSPLTVLYSFFYYEGGNIFTLSFVPIIILSVIACVQSKKNLNKQKSVQ